MYFDGASHREGAGAGVVFLTPEGDVLPYAFTLTQLCSNNEAEYQALKLGLKMAVDMKQLLLEVYEDSKLIINQLLNIYEVRKPELVPYYNYATRMIGWLGGVTLEHVSRTKNRQADALAKLASSLALPDVEARISICQRWVIPPHFDDEYNDKIEANAILVFEIEKEDWRQSLIDYLQYRKLPENPHRRTDIRRRAPRFIYYNSTLYRHSFEGLLLRCLGENEAIQALEEAHSSICGAHQLGPKLHFRIKRMGYYWPTMVKDYLEFAKKCQACQFHANFIYQPPEPLHQTVASWPFDAWGLDVVGPLPKSSAGHLYNLAATDYFSKWAKVVPLREVKKETVVEFISNGLAEAFNKILENLLKKVVAKSKRDWHERIGEALWAYRTTYRTSTQATPYSLVYGVEVVLPLERQISSLRIVIQEDLTQEENARLRLEELEALDENRLKA
ncbi:uncharacterized protein LOC130786422 [Actinidia eriantha]|uniref:uncharacterized protein LOC130786422 n=1 Tax=Actinidia eriantha TaxID=165200 RepID=UPI002584633D|nr:uncharacterized protein LOC130786422 [Actinidia eriantha]